MRSTISFSDQARENLEKAQKIMSNQHGGGNATQEMAISYALKLFVENYKNKLNEEK